MRKGKFFNASNIPLAWSNDFDNVEHLHDAIEDATSAKELVKNVNNVARHNMKIKTVINFDVFIINPP